jgi:hypothetical protein
VPVFASALFQRTNFVCYIKTFRRMHLLRRGTQFF